MVWRRREIGYEEEEGVEAVVKTAWGYGWYVLTMIEVGEEGYLADIMVEDVTR